MIVPSPGLSISLDGVLVDIAEEVTLVSQPVLSPDNKREHVILLIQITAKREPFAIISPNHSSYLTAILDWKRVQSYWRRTRITTWNRNTFILYRRNTLRIHL